MTDESIRLFYRFLLLGVVLFFFSSVLCIPGLIHSHNNVGLFPPAFPFLCSERENALVSMLCYAREELRGIERKREKEREEKERTEREGGKRKRTSR